MVQSNLLWMLCRMQIGPKTWVSSHSLHYLDAIPLVLGPLRSGIHVVLIGSWRYCVRSPCRKVDCVTASVACMVYW